MAEESKQGEKPESRKFIEAFVDELGEVQKECPEGVREQYAKMLAAFPELSLSQAYSFPEPLFEMWLDFHWTLFRRANNLPALGTVSRHRLLAAESEETVADYTETALKAIELIKAKQQEKAVRDLNK